jgi:hypothetical protein
MKAIGIRRREAVDGDGEVLFIALVFFSPKCSPTRRSIDSSLSRFPKERKAGTLSTSQFGM